MATTSPKISKIHAHEILDSRGNPTVEVAVELSSGIRATACVPSGASTGEHEAIELRDKDEKRYMGKGVLKACQNVNGPIQKLLMGKPIGSTLKELADHDRHMIEADGTENKSHFGANSILGVSMALARAAAKSINLPLYRYIGGNDSLLLPCPMLNVLNGGAHSDNTLEFQEFMIRPHGFLSFSDALRAGVEVFHTLKGILKKEGYSTSVGDEGGFAPNLTSEKQALEILVRAIEKAGYAPGDEISLALDCAASEFFDKTTGRYIEKKKKTRGEKFIERTATEQVAYLASLVQEYPIDSIEDGLAENDWAGWKELTAKLDSIQIVGDDIFVTNPKFLLKGMAENVGNAILIKLNQIGTVTETLATIHLAKQNGYQTIISHRSGETEDSFIADLAVGTHAGQIKTGAPCRSERVAKYNRLLQIEQELGPEARYYE